ncbi:MAG: hypothetical protein NC102_00525 [Clostridium sp.]|nr:hypothetical protein [Clostridium sp.]
MISPRAYSAFGTAAAVLAAVSLMMCTHLSLADSSVDAMTQDAVEIDFEEYIDVMEMPASPNMAPVDDPSAAQSPERNESQPTPASGTDAANAGPAGDPPPTVASKEESPVKEQKKPEKPAGPSKEELKRQEEQRMAENEVTNAFSHASGKHNTADGKQDNGNSGRPDSPTAQGAHTGHGAGSAGDGWAIPAYGAVKSPVTGSVKMTLTINREGQVTDVKFTGGDAPAATNQTVRNACAIEVRRHRFTRANPETAPETSRAYITYTFK